MHFRVHGSKKPCTRQQNHAPRVQCAPLISDTAGCQTWTYDNISLNMFLTCNISISESLAVCHISGMSHPLLTIATLPL